MSCDVKIYVCKKQIHHYNIYFQQILILSELLKHLTFIFFQNAIFVKYTVVSKIVVQV